MGFVAERQERYEDARDYYKAAYERGSAVLPAEELGKIMLNLSSLMIDLEEIAEAATILTAAVKCFASDPLQLAKVWGNQAKLALKQGKATVALRRLRSAQPVFEQYDARLALVINTLTIGVAHLKRQDYDQAVAYLERAASAADALGAPFTKAKVLSNLAETYVWQGNWSRAEPTLEEVRLLALSINLPLTIAEAWVDEGEMWRLRGDMERAAAAWQSAHRLFAEQASPRAAWVARRLQQLMAPEPPAAS